MEKNAFGQIYYFFLNWKKRVWEKNSGKKFILNLNFEKVDFVFHLTFFLQQIYCAFSLNLLLCMAKIK